MRIFRKPTIRPRSELRHSYFFAISKRQAHFRSEKDEKTVRFSHKINVFPGKKMSKKAILENLEWLGIANFPKTYHRT